MAASLQKPPMDSELRAKLSTISFPMLSHINPEVIKMMRSETATPSSYLDDLTARGISHTEVRIPSHDNSSHEIILSVLQRASKSTKPRPCVYYMHGGGWHWGDRLHTLDFPTDLIVEFDAVCVSVEYRLAPEFSFTVAVEDCYTGLKWTSEHNLELGINPARIMVGGTSAGGGLAATIVQLCHQRHGPVVVAQILTCPGLDDRLDTISAQQYVEESDILPYPVMTEIWRSSLKHNKGSSHITISPAGRAEDLSGLPEAYLDVGSAEVLRDETVAYASKLWASGVQAELHVWAGGFHGSDMFLPDALISQAARAAKLAWVKKIFERDSS